MAQSSADSRYLRFLIEAGELLSQSLDVGETLQNVCTAAVNTIADFTIVDLREGGRLDLRAAAHRDPQLTREASHAGAHLRSAAGRPEHYVQRVVRTGQPFFAPRIDDRWIEENATSDVHALYIRRMGYRSMVVVPVTSVTYGIEGALTLVTTTDGKPPLETEDAVLFALDLGRRCGVALGKARLHHRALEIGWRFQQAALPRVLAPSENVRCSALYEPAMSSLLVGGDWYDVFSLRDGRIGISVGDASGHGLDAAIVMASMKNSLHTALIMTPDIAAALSAADFVMQSEWPDMYCTAMLAVLDPRARTLSCEAAGHPGPKMWIPSAGAVRDPFADRGLPLGMRRLARVAQRAKTISIEPGTTMVFYTDGLVEAERDYLDGEKKLEAALAREDVRGAASVATAIRNAVVEKATRDDLAIIAVHIIA